MFDDADAFVAPEGRTPPVPELVEEARAIFSLRSGQDRMISAIDHNGDTHIALVVRYPPANPGWGIHPMWAAALFRNQLIPPQTTEEQWVKLLQLFHETGDFRPFIRADLPDFLK